MPLTDRMIWVDIETFGLDTHKDFITEVGFKITDLDLNTIDDFQTCVWSTPEYDTRLAEMKLSKKDLYVYNMHVKSGLWGEARRIGAAPQVAEREICEWLEGHGVTKDTEEPLCGSSVHFDRGMLEVQMPLVFERFHYRIIDNSVLKGLCQAFNPRLYEQMPPHDRKTHRVLPDIEDSINEFRFYKDNFMFEGGR